MMFSRFQMGGYCKASRNIGSQKSTLEVPRQAVSFEIIVCSRIFYVTHIVYLHYCGPRSKRTGRPLHPDSLFQLCRVGVCAGV